MKIWFLLVDGQTTGPFDVSEVESQLPKFKDPLIWGRGQGEWAPPAKWRKLLQTTHVGIQTSENTLLWQSRIEGREYPPMPFEAMTKHLKTLTDFSTVDIKSSESSSWKDIYSVQKVIDSLGISRRSHPRVPIMGELDCEASNHSFVARALSISEGGLGVNDTSGLVIGEKLRVHLRSPNLFTSIDGACEVVYVGGDGYAGLRFIGLPPEAKSTIIEYVKKFSIPV